MRAAEAAFYMYCDEPDPPYCAEQYGEFDDEDEFSSCRSDMEDYKDDVDKYLQCLASNSNEAADEYGNTVDSFNARAGG